VTSYKDPNQQLVDPVLPDQGGRLTGADPGNCLPPTQEELKRRAYEHFEARGKHDGAALDDWLAAESEMNSRHNSKQLDITRGDETAL
jgi:hypothetical protein